MSIIDVRESAAAFLKYHTSQTHQDLEQIVLPRLMALRTMDDYIVLLKNFYGYFKPVEEQVERHIDTSILPDIHQRRKADSIQHDLTFSKAHIVHLPLATNLPVIENTYQAFGALYVLEGSTQGGRGITKMLLKNEHLQLEENQVHFFNGYGAETGHMWTRFLKALNQHGNNQSALEAMTTTANETFTLFQQWLQTKQ